jgi:uncharacterized protein
MSWILYVIVGGMAGIFGGILGIGGGIIMIPALVYLFKLTQHQAQGTSLAVMIPPIGLLAAWKYYTNGNVRLDMVVFMCVGFFIGGYFGAVWAQFIPDQMLRKIFGVFMMFVSFNLIFGK